VRLLDASCVSLLPTAVANNTQLCADLGEQILYSAEIRTASIFGEGQLRDCRLDRLRSNSPLHSGKRCYRDQQASPAVSQLLSFDKRRERRKIHFALRFRMSLPSGTAPKHTMVPVEIPIVNLKRIAAIPLKIENSDS